MTETEARDEIRAASQNCEEIGLGDGSLCEGELEELEANAARLILAVLAYRQAKRT